MTDPPTYPGTPRWLRIFVIAVGTVALLLVVLAHRTGVPRRNLPLVGTFDHSAMHATEESGR